MDVKIASMNGYLEESIYMMQPEGLWLKGNGRKSASCLVPFMD